MGQLKKLVPAASRNKIVGKVESHLPEKSFRRNQFANAISISGALLVFAGGELDRRGHQKLGAIVRTIGHTADDFDGDASLRLGTNGRTGALVDASLDKIKVAKELQILWRHAGDIGQRKPLKRKAMIGAIATKHVATAAINTAIEQTGARSEVSLAGKANMWVDGLTFAAISIADATPSGPAKHAADRVADGLFLAGMVIGGIAAAGYGRELVAVKTH